MGGQLCDICLNIHSPVNSSLSIYTYEREEVTSKCLCKSQGPYCLRTSIQIQSSGVIANLAYCRDGDLFKQRQYEEEDIYLFLKN